MNHQNKPVFIHESRASLIFQNTLLSEKVKTASHKSVFISQLHHLRNLRPCSKPSRCSHYSCIIFETFVLVRNLHAVQATRERSSSSNPGNDRLQATQIILGFLVSLNLQLVFKRLIFNRSCKFTPPEIRENEPPKLGVMEGTLVAKHVWCLPPGRRIIVHFNEYDQPVRKGGLVLVHFLSDLSKDASFCPLGAHTWKHVDDHYKERIIKTVHDKFVLPDRTEICRMLLLFVNLKWKHYKWKLHQAYYNPNMSKEKMIEKKPENVTKEQWINLVSYWCSEKFKTLSSLGKRAREMQDQVRTTGSQSYARGKCDFVKEYGREPTSLEWWKRSHVKKNGGYVDGTRTREFLETAENIVDERLCTSDQTREVIETEVFNELMYDAEKTNQRLVGYGVGVTRNHVFGPEAIFRKAKLGNGGVISSEVMSIKSYLVSAERKNDELLSQLQKRNEAVEKENEELRAKNEQILAQLNRVASFIEKHEQTQG